MCSQFSWPQLQLNQWMMVERIFFLVLCYVQLLLHKCRHCIFFRISLLFEIFVIFVFVCWWRGPLFYSWGTPFTMFTKYISLRLGLFIQKIPWIRQPVRVLFRRCFSKKTSLALRSKELNSRSSGIVGSFSLTVQKATGQRPTFNSYKELHNSWFSPKRNLEEYFLRCPKVPYFINQLRGFQSFECNWSWKTFLVSTKPYHCLQLNRTLKLGQDQK